MKEFKSKVFHLESYAHSVSSCEEYFTAWIEGYTYALDSFGIWKDGTQVIGCMETPIREMKEELEERLEAAHERLTKKAEEEALP